MQQSPSITLNSSDIELIQYTKALRRFECQVMNEYKSKLRRPEWTVSTLQPTTTIRVQFVIKHDGARMLSRASSCKMRINIGSVTKAHYRGTKKQWTWFIDSICRLDTVGLAGNSWRSQACDFLEYPKSQTYKHTFHGKV